MCWLILMLRMIFKTKRLESDDVDDDDDDVYLMSKPSDVSAESRSFPSFPRLPDDCMGHVFSFLSYADAQSLRASSQQMKCVFDKYRSKICGPSMSVYIDVANDRSISAHGRLAHQIYKTPVEIPPAHWSSIFRNAKICLIFRLGANEFTAPDCRRILDTFKRTTVDEVQVRAASVSRQMLELINAIECPKVGLSISAYSELVEQVNNLDSLRIHDEISSSLLETIFAWNHRLENFSAKVPSAALQLILDGINEWRVGQRHITSWYFRIPHADLIRDLGRIPESWRRSMTSRQDGTGRLLMQTVTLPMGQNDTVTYQSVNWLFTG